MNKEDGNILLDKLNQFISKYYRNKILKGLIFLISALLIFFILFSVLEYLSRFSSTNRSVIFWSYILLNFIVLVIYIIIPLFNLLKIGNRLNYKQAAVIIGKYFPEIDDKILNIIQLDENNNDNNNLTEASIIQKTNNIKVFNFRNAVDLKENKKYLKWILTPIILLIIFIFSGNKNIITESSARIIDHNIEYIPQAPFRFIIENEKLEVVQHENFKLVVKIEGEKIPSNLYIEIEGNKFNLAKDKLSEFHFLFSNVMKNTSFKFHAEGFQSEEYHLMSLLKPTVLEFKTRLKYPSYTNIQDKTIQNIGDFSLPEGTTVNWEFKLQNTDSLIFRYNENSDNYITINNTVNVQKIILSNTNYSISTKNRDVTTKKTFYSISVIKDEFPKINLEVKLDSVTNHMYFNGNISDDYKLKILHFNYEVKTEDSIYTKQENITINQLSKESYYHFLDLNSLNLSPSDEIKFYFEIWDNDRVNGSKSSKTINFSYNEPSKEDLTIKRNAENEKIKKNIDNTIKLAEEIQEDIKNLKRDLIDKKELGWEEKKKAEDIIKKQKELEKQIKENNKRNNKNNKIQEKINSSILEKQKKLEQLMEKVLDEESKKLLEDLQRLLEEMNKEKMKEVLDKMEKDNTDLEKELDRNLEIYKELEFEQKLEETINKIDKLKEKQKRLKKKTEEKESKTEGLIKEQEKLQEELDKLKEDLKELEEQNKELEKKKDLPDLEKEEEKASEKMEESKNSLKKKKKKKAAKEQEESIEELEEMSEKMKSLQSSESESKPIEDMETLRQILENLITLSFNQEELISKISDLPSNSNSIISYIQKQKKLSDDSQIIEDSLLALSKRVIQIESIINKEINSINFNIEKSISFFEERKINLGVSKQQFVMTSVNNLALLLSETLKQMQMDLANKKPGTKQCNKPGSGTKPSLKELKKMQEQLKKKMKEQKGKKGEKGKKGKKNGKEPSTEGNSKALMQLAEQQQKIRQRLQELRDEIGINGEKGKIDRILEKMEENETDMLNNNITNETLLRQEEILSKLLEAEETQREKGEEEKRESIEWNYEIENSNSNYLEYINKKKEQEELLKTTPIQLNPFYKEKVNQYFNDLTEEKK